MTLKFKAIAVFALALSFSAFAQQNTLTTTTLSAALDNKSQLVYLTSSTGVTSAPANPTSNAYIDQPTGTSFTILYVDGEAMRVFNQLYTNGPWKVERGSSGTKAVAHISGATVFVGPASYFALAAPAVGSACTASTLYVSPVVHIATGDVYRCIAGIWQRGTGLPSALKPYTAFTTLSAPNAIATNATTYVAGTVFFDQLYIPASTTLTGACALNGATVGTDKVIYVLYDAAGNVLANTATAGTTTATASKYQCIAFTSTVSVVGPGMYFIGVQGNGTTDNVQTYAANGAPTNYGANSTTGTFGTLAAITPTVSFTANKGPLMMVY